MPEPMSSMTRNYRSSDSSITTNASNSTASTTNNETVAPFQIEQNTLNSQTMQNLNLNSGDMTSDTNSIHLDQNSRQNRNSDVNMHISAESQTFPNLTSDEEIQNNFF